MRLIDADEYIKKLRERIGIEPTWSHSGLRIAIFELHNMPTIDAVEVVRCGECKHRDPEDRKCDCGHDILWQLPRDDNWFCADGERREDNGC